MGRGPGSGGGGGEWGRKQRGWGGGGNRRFDGKDCYLKLTAIREELLHFGQKRYQPVFFAPLWRAACGWGQ